MSKSNQPESNTSDGPLTDVEALQGNKGVDWVLKVSGNATVYTDASTVQVSNQDDGFNPTIALFKVAVKHVQGPMKGQPRPFVIERKATRGRYNQVTLNIGEDNSVTVDITEVKTVL